MKMKSKVERYEDVGFVCDVCMASVYFEDNDMQASLSAKFGHGSEEDGNEYHLDLCLTCFKTALAEMKVIRRNELMFDESVSDEMRYPDKFGLVPQSKKDDFQEVQSVESRRLNSDEEEGS